jgi:hypothetical protein
MSGTAEVDLPGQEGRYWTELTVPRSGIPRLRETGFFRRGFKLPKSDRARLFSRQGSPKFPQFHKFREFCLKIRIYRWPAFQEGSRRSGGRKITDRINRINRIYRIYRIFKRGFGG